MNPTAIPADRVGESIDALRAAQRAWQALPVRERLRPVRPLRNLLATECDALCDVVARDLGKSTEETIAGDLLPLAAACKFLEGQAAGLLRPRHVSSRLRPLWLPRQRDVVYRRPRGVVGIIGTWNYPLFLNGTQAVQALAAGNAVLWKPSEVAPSAAAALLSLFHRAGFPADLAQMIEPTRDAGSALTDAAVDFVVFTGSANTGRRVAAHLADRLIPAALELSGCDALFVLDDADLNLAAKAAWFGATANRGQTCIAVRRAFVDRTHYLPFCDLLQVMLLEVGPMRLALPGQVEQAKRLVRRAANDGARVLTAGEMDIDDPLVFAPTVVMDAKPEMDVCREATFAPLLAVMPFDRLDDALRMNEQCPYGLGASIFTRNTARAEELAPRLKAGMVTINDVMMPTAHPATPFGGRGDSGYGVTQGAEGLLEMTVPQVVSVRGGTYRPHYEMAVGQVRHQEALLRSLLDAAHAPGLGRRVRGFFGVLGALWRGR
jgi:acyl-CoA reductase-like NAD-dependent aldehyde dehydrogenase